ncbi:MAG: hypothetical protein ACM3X6_04610 [Patescibacteria group bacterium]
MPRKGGRHTLLLSTSRTVALRCPLCGRFQIHTFSLFSFVRGRPLAITCGCGFNKMTISAAAHKNYRIQLACLACTGTHPVYLRRGELWGDALHRFHCPEVGAEVGYLGPEQTVRRVAAEERDRLDSIANDLGFDDFFIHPEIMLGTLAHLHFLAGSKNLGCQCGNQEIEVDVFPDKLELRCMSCDSLLIVYAETPEDLAAVRRMPGITMSERGFASIDASKMRLEQ